MSRYARGPSDARDDVATFEYKPGASNHTGGGYPRWRSWEFRPHTARQGKEDVFVAVHRLAAVAWHLPDGELGADVHLADLDGVDVHHVQPDGDGPGMPSANGEVWTTLLDHGTHSSVTQAERRAWAEDAKEGEPEPDRCAECGGTDGATWAVEGVDGVLCLHCATAVADGRTITEA